MIYENARFRALSKVNLSLKGILLFFTFRADAMKDDVITGEVETMGIPNPVLEAGNKIHIHIKDSPAYFTFYMTVIAADMVETIGTPRYLKTANFAHLR